MKAQLSVPRALIRPTSGENFYEIEQLPWIHMVADRNREKDKVQRSHADILF